MDLLFPFIVAFICLCFILYSIRWYRWASKEERGIDLEEGVSNHSDITDESLPVLECPIRTSGEQPFSSGYKLKLGKLLGDTFVLYWRNFGTMCLLGLIVGVIPAIFDVCDATVEGNRAFQFFSSLFSFYMSILATFQCLYTARGGVGLQRGLMILSFSRLWRVFVYVLIYCGVLLACLIPAGIAHTMGVRGYGWAWIVFFCILAVIWCFVRLYLALWFIVDRNARVFNSIGNAWQVSSGNFWALLGALFVLSIPIFSCLVPLIHYSAPEAIQFYVPETIQETLLLNIGFIAFNPIFYLGMTLAYLQLTGQQNCLDLSVALRSRKEGEQGEVPLDAVVEKLAEEVRMRVL
jgi:hypothetical protein